MIERNILLEDHDEVLDRRRRMKAVIVAIAVIRKSNSRGQGK